MDQEVEEIKERFGKDLSKFPNVVGFHDCLVPKIHKGREYPEILAFRIYVSKKLSMSELNLKDQIPFSFILRDGREIFTDIVEINK